MAYRRVESVFVPQQGFLRTLPIHQADERLTERFDSLPRRILLWDEYPAHPLRKDYPVAGRGERENYRIVPRDSA